MPNNINRRVQAYVTNQEALAQEQAAQAAAARQREEQLRSRVEWTSDNVSRFVGMSSLRLFLTLRRPERTVVRREQERRANTEWLNHEVTPIDNLCATFRRWALENSIPCNVGLGNQFANPSQKGWHIRAIKTGERLQDHFDYDARLPYKTTKHITGEHWFIPSEPMQPGYNTNQPAFQNLMCEKTGEVEGDTLPSAHGFNAKPLEIQYDNAWLSTAAARVEEGIYQWAREYPHMPFPED